MINFLERFFGSFRRETKTQHDEHRSDVQVLVPEAVELPLPKRLQEEISVPASINGRDLSTGRL
jgi:hypothetical protein